MYKTNTIKSNYTLLLCYVFITSVNADGEVQDRIKPLEERVTKLEANIIKTNNEQQNAHDTITNNITELNNKISSLDKNNKDNITDINGKLNKLDENIKQINDIKTDIKNYSNSIEKIHQKNSELEESVNKHSETLKQLLQDINEIKALFCNNVAGGKCSFEDLTKLIQDAKSNNNWKRGIYNPPMIDNNINNNINEATLNQLRQLIFSQSNNSLDDIIRVLMNYKQQSSNSSDTPVSGTNWNKNYLELMLEQNKKKLLEQQNLTEQQRNELNNIIKQQELELQKLRNQNNNTNGNNNNNFAYYDNNGNPVYYYYDPNGNLIHYYYGPDGKIIYINDDGKNDNHNNPPKKELTPQNVGPKITPNPNDKTNGNNNNNFAYYDDNGNPVYYYYDPNGNLIHYYYGPDG
ncbi:MAG: hypothetical protein IJ848_01400, partial [Alphaproteobacteria bacterium]|nr:hypothetical protein [Alphaproteobacteria bacterium]